jgi:hypothetical protein
MATGARPRRQGCIRQNVPHAPVPVALISQRHASLDIWDLGFKPFKCAGRRCLPGGFGQPRPALTSGTHARAPNDLIQPCRELLPGILGARRQRRLGFTSSAYRKRASLLGGMSQVSISSTDDCDIHEATGWRVASPRSRRARTHPLSTCRVFSKTSRVPSQSATIQPDLTDHTL